MRKLHLSQRGDTIIEVLFAITVIAVVISGAYAISTRATKSSQLSNERNAAIKIAESQLERLRETTANQILFNKAVSLGKSTTAKYCLVSTSNGDDVVIADNQNKCIVDNRYTVILTYDESGNFFTSRVEWDNDDTTPKNIELLYRVYGDTQIALTGQAGLNYAKASAVGLTQSDYSSASWQALQNALSMPEGTLAQINAKAAAISDALNGLMPATDLTAYNAALAAVQQSNYTPASWQAYQTVVNANQVTSQNSQAQIDTATQNIKNAQANLTFSPPVLTHTSVGTFTVNYSANYTYTSLPSASCTLSLSGNTMTGKNNSTNGTCTVTAKDVNGASASANYERKAYTTHNEWRVTGSHTITVIDWCGYWVDAGGGINVWCATHEETVYDYGWVAVKDSTPAGYSDSGSDWYRIY